MHKNIKMLFLLIFLVVGHSAIAQHQTTITSERLEMESGETENHFYFSENVKIVSENLKVTCDRLEVISARDKVAAANSQTTAKDIGAVQQIIAKGHVVLDQEGRHATAGQADIYPQEGKVVLTDNPVVIDDNDGKIVGYKMTFYRGERKALVEASPSGERPKVVLPAMPDLGFRDEYKEGRRLAKEKPTEESIKPEQPIPTNANNP